MACSAIYFLDMKGKVLLHRNYRGDIENTVIDKFIGMIFPPTRLYVHKVCKTMFM